LDVLVNLAALFLVITPILQKDLLLLQFLEQEKQNLRLVITNDEILNYWPQEKKKNWVGIRRIALVFKQ
jgi:hypothetical protein